MVEKVDIYSNKSNASKIYAFDYLRVIALFMILYDHLGGFYNPNWIVKKVIDFFFAVPLDIIQDFGAFGVSLFFLISGFLFMYNGNYKNETKKTLKKLLKTYLGCLIAFLLFYIIQKLTWIINTTYWSQFSIKQWIESATLIGYFTGYGDVINGTTWFLIPLFLFYLVRIGYAWNYEKTKPEYNFVFLEMIVLLIMILLNKLHLLVSSKLVFVYMPLAGMLLGEVFRKEKRISSFWGILLLVVNYMLMASWFWVFAREYHDTYCYFVSFIYSVFLIVIFAILKERFKKSQMMEYFCRISLSVYLMHMTFGSFLLTLFSYISMPFSLSFILTIIAIFLISYIHMNVLNWIIK